MNPNPCSPRSKKNFCLVINIHESKWLLVNLPLWCPTKTSPDIDCPCGREEPFRRHVSTLCQSLCRCLISSRVNHKIKRIEPFLGHVAKFKVPFYWLISTSPHYRQRLLVRLPAAQTQIITWKLYYSFYINIYYIYNIC